MLYFKTVKKKLSSQPNLAQLDDKRASMRGHGLCSFLPGIEDFPWEATSNFLPGKRKLGKRDINILEVEVIN